MIASTIHKFQRNRGVSRTTRVSSILPILIMLVLAGSTHGWSPSNGIFRSSTRRNAPSSASRKISHIQLQPSGDNNFQKGGFFEDPSQSMGNSNSTDTIASENDRLQDKIKQLLEENERLKKYVEEQHQNQLEEAAKMNKNNKRIVLETFEGEGLFDSNDVSSFARGQSNNTYSINEDDDELWCDVLDGDECPVEPSVSFGEALRDRAYWLVGLLIMQSLSGIILSRNELLLANHPVIIYYLTMMVGAGGNAGNQASVRVIRGIALGTLNNRTRGQFLVRELKMAGTLSLILSIAGFARTICFKTPLPEAITVTAALALIVFSSICLGAILPLILERIGVDPAHSSTTIQVIMDILGVLLAVLVSGAILDGPLGAYLLPKLGF